MPEKGLLNLKDQLFGLEANFETLQAIDFKKGCFVGQENTARMKLKNKLRSQMYGSRMNMYNLEETPQKSRQNRS